MEGQVTQKRFKMLIGIFLIILLIVAVGIVLKNTTLIYFGGSFLAASKETAYYMATKGKFKLSVNDNPVSLIKVS